MKDPKILLAHILESIECIEASIATVNDEGFYSSVEKQDAVERRLAIIGEVVRNLSVELKEKYSEIPWKNIAAMRNLLIHEYFDVSLKQVWIAVTVDIPKLKKVVQEMIQALSES